MCVSDFRCCKFKFFGVGPQIYLCYTPRRVKFDDVVAVTDEEMQEGEGCSIGLMEPGKKVICHLKAMRSGYLDTAGEIGMKEGNEN